MDTTVPSEPLRFGDFALDIVGYELRRHGRTVKIGRQPMDLLILLVERRRQLVSRGDIVERLWGTEVFVDVETGVNTAISKVRQALRDSPDAPRFVETVPGKGYRFVADVKTIGSQPSPDVGAPPLAPPSAPAPEPQTADQNRQTAPLSPSVMAPGLGSEVESRWASTHVRLTVANLAILAVVIGFLAWMRGGGRPVPAVAVAVLPFVNLGSDPEREYLAAGLTDETSASLAQVDPNHLTVKGRTLRYKGTTKTAAEIGQELAVDYLVESSIQSEGGRLRVTVTLTRVRDQAHVWSESYERQPASVLGLQEELSTAVADQVRSRISPERAAGLGRRQTRSAEAYDAYLHGLFQAGLRSPAGNARAVDSFKRAVAIDANYALAWSALAVVYTNSAINADTRPTDVGPAARAAALRAVRANPTSSEAQAAAGLELWLIDWDWTAAEAALRQAVALDPSNVSALGTLGHALSQSGQRDEATAVTRAARDLDLADPFAYAMSSQVAYQNRDWRAALDHARQAVALSSGFWIGHMQLGQALEGNGNNVLALEALENAIQLSGGNSKALSLRGYILGRMGAGRRHETSWTDWKPRRRSATCHPTRWRSYTWALMSVMQPSRRSSRPMRRATSTLSTCPWTPSGTPTGTTRVSSLSSPAAGLPPPERRADK
jgi:DNA-binding winged helix-turn-helix (wHTH) protein/TolB-like protein/tetratricopeptide (TPR) repeat protein